ncbi:MAG: glycosyltransferase family 39 protein [Solirubrobacteraceae bacterium]
MSTATPRRRRPLSALIDVPPIRDVHPPDWFERLPRRLTTAALLLALVIVSAFLRTRQLGGQLWFNEAIATGIAGHSLSQLPGVLRAAGASPLYYLLLHIWIQLFGSGESATHTLTVLFTLLTIPAGWWVAQGLAGRRAGIFAAVLFAFNAYLTHFSQETQPYALLVLLGLLSTGGFVQAFVHRRRRYLWLFTLGLTALLYTQGSAGLFAFGALAAFAVVWRLAPDRSGLLRDAAIGFGAPCVLYLPWLPTTIDQISHATSPWHYAPLLGATVPSDLLGGERVDATLLVAAVVGLAPLLARERRRTPEAITVWALIALPVAALLLARVSSLVSPSWVSRYFAPMVATLLLLAALSAARAKVIGVAVIVLCVGFLANPSSFVPTYKSDLRDVAGELGPVLHAQDLVVVGQPEQTPLAQYYMPGGLRFADTTGIVSDPTYMNWSGAQARLQHASPAATLGPLVASLKPGQQLLFVRPLTEGVQNWQEPWTKLVRRRSAQWGQILTTDVASGTLQRVASAPHYYRSACCVANSAILYQKVP